MRRPKRDWFYKLCQWIMRVPYFRLMGGVEVVGLEKIPVDGAVIVAPIHLSFVDPPLVGCHIRRHVSFMAKEQLFKVPVFGWLVRKLGSFPVSRGGADSSAVRRSLELLSMGELLLLFPEGTRGDGVTMGNIQAGMSMLAKKSGAPIIPVGISGSEKMLPRGAKLPRRQRCTLVFGEPFTFEEATLGIEGRAARTAFAGALSERIAAVTREAGLDVRSSPYTEPQEEPRRSETAPESAS